MEKNPKPKRKLGKKTLTVILIIVLVLLLIVLGVLLYVDHLIGLINYDDNTRPSMNQQEMDDYLNDNKDTTDPDYTGDILHPDDVTLETVDGSIFGDHELLNILLVGQDRRDGESRARSDSMILCSFNKSTKELTMISFMRDMYVRIPGYSSHKMNSAFAWGGFSLLNETLLTNFGIEPDGAFAVDFDGFEDVINAVGGVDITLTSSEANYLNTNCANGIYYTQGLNHLDGESALMYARIRYIGNADFDRTSRQQNVISAILDSCKNLSLSELNNLLETVLPMLTTNMDKSTIMSYAAELLPMVSGVTINERIRIPADGTYSFAWVSDMSVLMPDLEANRSILLEVLGDE